MASKANRNKKRKRKERRRVAELKERGGIGDPKLGPDDILTCSNCGGYIEYGSDSDMCWECRFGGAEHVF